MDKGGGAPCLTFRKPGTLWLSDFKDEELRYLLRTLLDAGVVEMTLDGKDRGFRLTVIGRLKLEKPRQVNPP